jgi:hypothetical protein
MERGVSGWVPGGKYPQVSKPARAVGKGAKVLVSVPRPAAKIRTAVSLAENLRALRVGHVKDMIK